MQTDPTDPKKSLGQHWLHDDAILEAIVADASVNASDTVVEVGPGLGTLTKKLVATGANIVAVEYDTSLLAGLNEAFAHASNFTLVHQDILQFDFTKLGSYKVVANIPYYLTSQLLRILGDSAVPPTCAVLLVQKEVAERVCSKPGDMSILAVAAQFEFEASLSTLVPARYFTPPPKVDSQVLVLRHREQPLFAGVDKKQFMRLVKAGFSAKRKTLRNTLSAGLAISKPQAEKLLAGAHIDPGLRAEALSLEDWKRLYDACQSMQIA